MTRNSLAVASALAVAAMLIAAFLVGSMLPAGAELPTHWGVSGEADGFSGKWPALLFPVALAVGMSALFYFLPSLEPRGDGLKRSQGLYAAVWMSMLLMAGVIELSVIAVALHWPLHAFHLIAAGLGVMFIMIGNQLGKSRSMYLIGIRTPWTLASEEVWVKTHRLGGKLMVLGGVLVVITAALPVPSGLLAASVLTAGLLAAGVPIAYSYLLWRREQGGQASG
ncbi:MAG: DUF1648 domain-containing protein [Alphaproteobacteria bacterium]|nr:MAG: DUF1648 domain-containing protein [Alphaproteobacteria bacterium]